MFWGCKGVEVYLEAPSPNLLLLWAKESSEHHLCLPVL